MEKNFTVLEVQEEKNVNIVTFYLPGEADIYWNTINGRLLGLEFSWNKFLDELKAKFYQLWFKAKRRKSL